jgi:hypothetical protein
MVTSLQIKVPLLLNARTEVHRSGASGYIGIEMSNPIAKPAPHHHVNLIPNALSGDWREICSSNRLTLAEIAEGLHARGISRNGVIVGSE